VPIIGKTGSTDNFNQTWVLASTTSVAPAVWVGNVEGFVNLNSGVRLNNGSARVTRHEIMRPIMATANALFGGADWPSPPDNLLGGRNAVVPNVQGLNLEDATKLIESVDLAVDTSCGTVDGRQAAGRVESTNPAIGTTLPTGTPINLCLSNGQLVAGPPSVIGQTEAAGNSYLVSRGWRVTVRYADPPTCTGNGSGKDGPTPTPTPTPTACPNPNQGKIIRQTPNGGSARPGSTVTITVQR
jgi:membrane peptidoglycan carboxypeptidase